MKCHYEILGIPMKATDEEIKKAYRKLALQWHPDKNPENIEECTKQFNFIQQAYDVLIDPQERAWYDRHRDSILKGGIDEHYADNSLNLFAYFSSNCYSGYGDNEKGFYTVYRGVFETIVNEDAPFMEEQEAEVKRIPSFGNSKSDYEEVVAPFYGYWQSYFTTKSYAWLDKFDIQQAPNRQVVRAMEKENKKIRDAARKERNEEIRELVSFVRKRDRRVQAYRRLLAEQRIEQMRKVEEHRRNQLRNRLKEIADYKEADWHDRQATEDALQDIEAQLARDFGDASESSADEGSNADSAASDGGIDQLYCPACEKAFKTSKAYQNHENSNKHKDNVKQLKEHMTEEEFRTLILERSGDQTGNLDDQAGSKKSKKTRKKQKDKRQQSGSDSEEEKPAASPATTQTNDHTPVELAEEKKVPDDGTRTHSKTDHASNDETTPAVCQTCQETFSSRNKLFDHLKATGHALLKGQPSKSSSKAKKATGKKGKR